MRGDSYSIPVDKQYHDAIYDICIRYKRFIAERMPNSKVETPYWETDLAMGYIESQFREQNGIERYLPYDRAWYLSFAIEVLIENDYIANTKEIQELYTFINGGNSN